MWITDQQLTKNLLDAWCWIGIMDALSLTHDLVLSLPSMHTAIVGVLTPIIKTIPTHPPLHTGIHPVSSAL